MDYLQDIMQAKPTYLQMLIYGIRRSLTELGAEYDDQEIESLALIIHGSMSGNGRNFHGVKHVFDISKGSKSPILILSAFFHDAVYYGVDGGLSEMQTSVLEGILEKDGKSGLYRIRHFSVTKMPFLAVALSIFGFSAGQVLQPFCGDNEFMSAVLALKCFSKTLSMVHLAQIATCIEATIPFQEKDCAERLYGRLCDTNKLFELGMSEDDLIASVHCATNLANRDVGNFAWSNHCCFLDNTWKLLPESNIPLRRSSCYTIYQYTLALKKMDGFFSNLDPDRVFKVFRDEPNEICHKLMTDRARRNINIARHYIRAKLLGLCTLSALAELTGGDGPLAMFMGDLPSIDRTSIQFEDFLPAPEIKADVDAEVFYILAGGRTEGTSFDVKNSPIAAYLYGIAGEEHTDEILEHASYPMDEEHSIRFLEELPREALKVIISACSRIALTRSKMLYTIDDLLKKRPPIEQRRSSVTNVKRLPQAKPQKRNTVF